MDEEVEKQTTLDKIISQGYDKVSIYFGVGGSSHLKCIST